MRLRPGSASDDSSQEPNASRTCWRGRGSPTRDAEDVRPRPRPAVNRIRAWPRPPVNLPRVARVDLLPAQVADACEVRDSRVQAAVAERVVELAVVADRDRREQLAAGSQQTTKVLDGTGGLARVTRLLVVADVLERRDADDQVVRPAGEGESVGVDDTHGVLVLVDDRVRRRRARVPAQDVADLEREPRISLCQSGETDRNLDGSLRSPRLFGGMPEVVVVVPVDDEARVEDARQDLAVREIPAGSESAARCAPDG